MTHTYKVKGMHCASCAGIIEKTFKKTPGVAAAEVNYGTETAKISFDETQVNPVQLSSKIETLGYSLAMDSMPGMDHSQHTGMNQSKHEKIMEVAAMKTKVVSIMPLALISIFVMTWDILAQFKFVAEMSYTTGEFFHYLMPIFATYALFVVGKPYLQGLYRFVRHGAANMDTLIGLGTVSAFTYSFIVSAFQEKLRPLINVDHTYFDVTIVVIAFITLGKYLEARSKIKTGDAIEKLLGLQAKTALVVRDGIEIELPIDQVVAGDLIVVKPAGKIPVDGTVFEGNSYVDEALVTGEPLPVHKKNGDTVIAGTLNTTGTFTFRATKVGSETLLAHIVQMVSDAQGSKAPIQALADKISSVFVPIVLVIAFIALILWIIVGQQYLGFSRAVSFGLVSFVDILVIACPCALGLATPTAIIVGVGKGAKEGILIRDAAMLEKLHKVTVIAVDKTGTITRGKPELISIENFSEKTDDALISILASLENKSEHPIAHAIVSYATEKNITLQSIDTFEAIKGRGVRGTVAGIEYWVGNPQLMKDRAINFDTTQIDDATRAGKTPVLIATAEKIIGIVMVADAIKPEAVEAVAALHKLGLQVVMITGDAKNTAAYIAKQVGIDEVLAEATPEMKMNKIKELQAQGVVVAMAGDGVNDAPALAQADVGIAMATGTDVAIESAGVTLLNGDILKLVKAIKLSKITMRGIKQNLFWAFFYNIIGIPLAAGLFYPIFGWMLNPVFAGLAMAFSSVSVVSNSLRITAYKL